MQELEDFIQSIDRDIKMYSEYGETYYETIKALRVTQDRARRIIISLERQQFIERLLNND